MRIEPVVRHDDNRARRTFLLVPDPWLKVGPENVPAMYGAVMRHTLPRRIGKAISDGGVEVAIRLLHLGHEYRV